VWKFKQKATTTRKQSTLPEETSSVGSMWHQLDQAVPEQNQNNKRTMLILRPLKIFPAMVSASQLGVY